MDSNEIKTLCLKHAYGAPLSAAEQTVVDEYTQTPDGIEYLQECREMKDLMTNAADVQIKPVDEKAMIQNFERTVRQTFEQTIFQPWWKANSPPILLALIAALFIGQDGWSLANSVLLGCCVLWVLADCLQRYYYAKVLNRPDLYEYAKASRKRSDRILQSPLGKAVVAVCSALATAAALYGVYWGYREFGLLVPAIAVFIVVEVAVIFVYQHRKLKRTDSEVWDWWAEEIKE